MRGGWIVGAIAWAQGCAATPSTGEGRPDWLGCRGPVVAGPRAVPGFAGSGVASHPNAALRRTNADAAARAQVAEGLERLRAGLVAGTRGPPIRVFLAPSAGSVAIVDRWVGPDGALHSFAFLDLAALDTALGPAADDAGRDAARRAVEAAFAALGPTSARRCAPPG